MKPIAYIILIVLSIQVTNSQEVTIADSLEIVNKINDWNKAWKTKDVALACKWYSENADFTNAFGFNRIGKSDIQTYLGEVFGFDFVMEGNTEQTSLKLRRISDKAILAITAVERTGQKTVGNKSLGTRNTTHYRLFEKTDQWKITAHLISDARSTESEKH
ncbi:MULTISPECIES: YybH family protein [Arenibacter]|uniref:YybH family protein n=1 Tax=Arenibacter TaxID=178469 RepID=UPI0004DF2950|nr:MULTISPECIES: nuclear transport factor 2 family protein [Arenibacter]GBF22504.1 hypothetical protein C21_04699 [Arenibacter sp. NBRC 103722]